MRNVTAVPHRDRTVQDVQAAVDGLFQRFNPSGSAITLSQLRDYARQSVSEISQAMSDLDSKGMRSWPYVAKVVRLVADLMPDNTPFMHRERQIRSLRAQATMLDNIRVLAGETWPKPVVVSAPEQASDVGAGVSIPADKQIGRFSVEPGIGFDRNAQVEQALAALDAEVTDAMQQGRPLSNWTPAAAAIRTVGAVEWIARQAGRTPGAALRGLAVGIGRAQLTVEAPYWQVSVPGSSSFQQQRFEPALLDRRAQDEASRRGAWVVAADKGTAFVAQVAGETLLFRSQRNGRFAVSPMRAGFLAEHTIGDSEKLRVFNGQQEILAVNAGSLGSETLSPLVARHAVVATEAAEPAATPDMAHTPS